MIQGVHMLVYSRDAAADRAFLRDVLGWPHVDAGEGWTIFATPPAEVGVHPVMEEDGDAAAAHHEIYLMVADIHVFVDRMRRLGRPVTDVVEQPWGALVQLTLPGGSPLGVYQPYHPSPHEQAKA